MKQSPKKWTLSKWKEECSYKKKKQVIGKRVKQGQFVFLNKKWPH